MTFIPASGSSGLASLSASFVQPNPGATVAAAVASSANATLGEGVSIPGGGYYFIEGIPDGVTLMLQNTGSPVNAPPLTTVGASGTTVFAGVPQDPVSIGNYPVEGPIAALGEFSTGVLPGTPLTVAASDYPASSATWYGQDSGGNTNLANSILGVVGDGGTPPYGGDLVLTVGRTTLFQSNPYNPIDYGQVSPFPAKPWYSTVPIGGPTPTPFTGTHFPRIAVMNNFDLPTVGTLWVFSDDGASTYFTAMNPVTGAIVASGLVTGALPVSATWVGNPFSSTDDFVFLVTADGSLWKFDASNPSTAPTSTTPFGSDTPTQYGITSNDTNMWVCTVPSDGQSLTLWQFGLDGTFVTSFNSIADGLGPLAGFTAYGITTIGNGNSHVYVAAGITGNTNLLAVFKTSTGHWLPSSTVNLPGGVSNLASSPLDIGIPVGSPGFGCMVLSTGTNATNSNQTSAIRLSGGDTPAVVTTTALFLTGSPGPDPGIRPTPGPWMPQQAQAGDGGPGDGIVFSPWPEGGLLGVFDWDNGGSLPYFVGLVSETSYSGDFGVASITTLGNIRCNTITADHGGGGGGGGNIFVYRDSATPSGNVYATFHATYEAAFTASANGPVIIVVDDSLHTCSITDGEYDMTNISLEGTLQEMTSHHNPLVAVLTLNYTGRIFKNLRSIKNLSIIVNSSFDVMAPGGDDEEEADWLILDYVSIDVTNTGMFAQADNVDNYTVFMRNGSQIVNGGTNGAFGYGETELIFYMFDNSSIAANTINGDIGAVIFYIDPTSSVALPQTLSIGQTNGRILLGGSQVAFDSDVTIQSLQATQVIIAVGMTTNHNLTLPTPPAQDMEITLILGDATGNSFSFTILGTINQTTNYVVSGQGSTATVRYNFTSGWQLV